MSKTLTLPDQVHDRLERQAKASGFASVEDFIQSWNLTEDEMSRRKRLADRLRELRGQIKAKHGVMPDSVSLLREDRER